MPTDPSPPEPPEPPLGEEGFRVMDARFWMAIVFLIACLIAAGVVAFWGPKIWPRTPARPVPSAAHAAPARP